MNFIARADGSVEMGSGHVMRLLTIAEELVSRGHNVTFCCCSLTTLLEQYIRALNCDIIIIDGQPSSDADIRHTVKAGKDVNAHSVILDGYEFDENYLLQLKNNFKLVFLDDEIKLKNIPADIVINTSPFTNSQLYKSSAQGARLMLGPKYALLRKEFRELANSIKPLEKRKNIMVTFGGTDVLGLTMPVTKALIKVFGEEQVFDIVTSKKLDEADFDNVNIHENCNYMAKLMSRCALAISAGGTTLGELSVMEVPTILVVVADNQEKHATWVKNNGINLVIDARNEPNVEEKIGLAAGDLMNNPARRAEMAYENKKIVDGHGVVRVVDQILSL